MSRSLQLPLSLGRQGPCSLREAYSSLLFFLSPVPYKVTPLMGRGPGRSPENPVLGPAIVLHFNTLPIRSWFRPGPGIASGSCFARKRALPEVGKLSSRGSTLSVSGATLPGVSNPETQCEKLTLVGINEFAWFHGSFSGRKVPWTKGSSRTDPAEEATKRTSSWARKSVSFL